MKKDNPLLLTLSPKTLSDEEVDYTRLVVSDEFNARGSGDYRDRAIARLVKDRVQFYSEGNLTYNLFGKYVKIVCPYCAKNMKPNGGGGNGHSTTLTYKCSCGAESTLSVANEALTFKPKTAKG